MRPRSLVVDLYGDYVRYRGGEVSLQTITALLRNFGVSAETGRVTVARLRAQGWLSSRRLGRSSWYALTPHSWHLLDEGRERMFQRRRAPWTGEWYMAIYNVPEPHRAERELLRRALSGLGFGPLVPSTWVSPHNRFPDLREALEAAGVKARTELFTARTGSLERDRDLASRCWDLDGLQHGYAQFVRAWHPRVALYRAGEVDDLHCLIDRVRLVDEYRRFPRVDPDLPVELLPPAWQGSRAHALFLDIYARLRAPAFRSFDAVYRPPPQ